MEDQKNTHGGARTGAGRKNMHKRPMSFKFIPRVYNYLKSYQGNKTEFVEKLVMEHEDESNRN